MNVVHIVCVKDIAEIMNANKSYNQLARSQNMPKASFWFPVCHCSFIPSITNGNFYIVKLLVSYGRGESGDALHIHSVCNTSLSNLTFREMLSWVMPETGDLAVIIML